MEATNAIKTVERISPLERAMKVATQRGWRPLTEEDKAALDDAVRMVTHLD